MIPEFELDGTLPPGLHWASWEEIVERFGYSAHRQNLLSGFRMALDSLRIAGCRTVFLDGSFVTTKHAPEDFDACWDTSDVDPHLLDPLLLEFRNGRAAQKAFYGGELFPSQLREGGSDSSFLAFFQTHKETGAAKGVIAISLGMLL